MPSFDVFSPSQSRLISLLSSLAYQFDCFAGSIMWDTPPPPLPFKFFRLYLCVWIPTFFRLLPFLQCLFWVSNKSTTALILISTHSMGPQQPPFAKSISVIPRSVRVYVNIIRARNNQRPCDAPERGKKVPTSLQIDPCRQPFWQLVCPTDGGVFKPPYDVWTIPRSGCPTIISWAWSVVKVQ